MTYVSPIQRFLVILLTLDYKRAYNIPMIRYQFYITEEQLDFLNKLPEPVSQNIRRAIDEFIEKRAKKTVSTSLSKK